MNIQIHADEIGKNLFDETNDVQACCINALFGEIVAAYTTGYRPYIEEMVKNLSSDSLTVMADIVKEYSGFNVKPDGLYFGKCFISHEKILEVSGPVVRANYEEWLANQ